MYLKEKIPRSSFLSFFDDFRYAGATIVALCSQGLKSKKVSLYFLIKHLFSDFSAKINFNYG
jgi:hypothetical protein